MDADLGDLKNAPHILDVALRLGPIAIFGGIDLAFGQEPGQCSHHSGGDRGNDMIQRRRVLLFWFHAIELLDPPMNTIEHGLGESLDERLSYRSLYPGNRDP